MKRSAALAAWTDDPLAQRATRGRIAASARACHALPALVRLRAELTAAGGDPAAIEAAAVDLLGDTAWLGTLVTLLAGAAAADPFAEPPFLPIDNGLHEGLILHDDADVVVAIGIGGLEALAARKARRSGPASITLSGYRTHLRFLKAGGATLAFYRLAGPPGEERCVLAGRRRITDGERLAIDGTRTGWVVERAAGDLVVLQATMKAGRGDVVREYDADSGRPIAVATNDEAASRMQMLVSLLAASGADGAADAIAGCLADAHAFVRWHAMRELVALSPDTALLPLMAMAAGDGEPQVRDAARATLSLLQPCRA